MKPFQIFKPGKHTASSGQVIEFTEDMLRAAVAAYDPTVHEAPIVVGHPKDNGPAYGWVKSLSFDDSGAVVVDTQQVDADFSEMVQAGRFKKRSASWYLPDSPTNPKPGTLYLRHVGFLGAQPPAVKGLKEVAFTEGEGIVEFSETGRWAFRSMADVLRNLREWLIADKGLEAADKVVPSYSIDSITAAADERDDDDVQPMGVMPAFSEEDPMKIEELQAQVATLTAENAALKAKEASFTEQATSIEAREAAVREAEAKIARAAVEARVDAAIKAGRVLPAKRKAAVDFAMGLADGEATIDFGEGEKAVKITQRDAYLRELEAGPKVVDYSERAPAAGGAPDDKATDPAVVAEKARDLVKARQAEGKTLSFTEAVAEVMAADSAA